ncbi:hypothetical protein [Ralstonia mannitolilytica]|nr:hypothetical protein [Ralstonia mannitolilytica]
MAVEKSCKRLAGASALFAWLHNQTPLEIQTRLHVQGRQMVLLPMNVG